MKEGYLQIKINEVADRLIEIEHKTESLLKIIDDKQKEINILFDKMPVKFNELNESIKKGEELQNLTSKMLENVKQFHEDNYHRIFNKTMKELNKQLEEIRKAMNYTIIDHTTHAFVLQKYLTEKGLINLIEFIAFIDRYHDEIRDINLKSEDAQKTLEIKSGYK
jgi:DNA anti-recombination protein RmuC